MKRIRRSISPLMFGGLGAWMLLRKDASLEILGIAVIVMSGLGIVLSATDKESSKAGRVVHVGLDGVLAAGGAALLVSPDRVNQYLKYGLGGVVVVYGLLTMRRMIKYRYRKGFTIAEGLPVLMGAALILVPLDQPAITTASGAVLAATGAITLAGHLFGRKKDTGKEEKHG